MKEATKLNNLLLLTSLTVLIGVITKYYVPSIYIIHVVMLILTTIIGVLTIISGILTLISVLLSANKDKNNA